MHKPWPAWPPSANRPKTAFLSGSWPVNTQPAAAASARLQRRGNLSPLPPLQRIQPPAQTRDFFVQFGQFALHRLQLFLQHGDIRGRD